MAPKFTSRKFLLTAFFAVTGAIGWFAKRMDGAEYVALATLILSAYGASNVAAKKVVAED